MLLCIITILAAITVHTSLGQVCPYRECSCTDTVINCSNRNLTSIPTRLNAGTTYTTLQLNGNRITTVNAGIQLPTRLSFLDLSDNPITTMTSDPLLLTAQTLKTIKFRNSNFAALPAALEVLSSLDTLDIENDAMTFSEQTMSKLSETVETLRLVNVGLTSWPTWLQYFVFLRRLTLDNNRLREPPGNAFDFLRQSLTHMSLSNIGASSFGNISALENLQWLDLSENNLTNTISISYDLIPFGNTLQYLDISSNALTTEPRLADLRVLTEVRLSNNKLANVNYGAFAPSVTSLYLDNNLFPSVPSFLSDLPQLQLLNMLYNQITSIEENDFKENTHLTTVYLGDNPLSRIDLQSFQPLRSSLLYLNLENTHLTRLPLALTVLTKLQTLWLANNERLMCSCEEVSYGSWLSSLPDMRLVGQCGYRDITEFVAMLVAGCP